MNLSAEELSNIDGGMVLFRPDVKKIYEYAEKVSTAIGLADAVDRFMEGFSRGNCH